MAVATNNKILDFTAGPVGADATHFGFWTAAVNGIWLGGTPINTNPTPLAANDRYQFGVSAIGLTFPRGEWQEAMAQRSAAGGVAGTLYISIHSADPGITGANEIPNSSRVVILSSEWTIT